MCEVQLENLKKFEARTHLDFILEDALMFFFLRFLFRKGHPFYAPGDGRCPQETSVANFFLVPCFPKRWVENEEEIRRPQKPIPSNHHQPFVPPKKSPCKFS